MHDRIVLEYFTSAGDCAGAERIDLPATFRGDPQAVAYNYASVRANSHGVRLESLRRVR